MNVMDISRIPKVTSVTVVTGHVTDVYFNEPSDFHGVSAALKAAGIGHKQVNGRCVRLTEPMFIEDVDA